MVWDIILLTIGILAVIEGLLLVLFTKQFIQTIKQLSKSNKLRKVALTELFIGILLVLISFYLMKW